MSREKYFDGHLSYPDHKEEIQDLYSDQVLNAFNKFFKPFLPFTIMAARIIIEVPEDLTLVVMDRAYGSDFEKRRTRLACRGLWEFNHELYTDKR